MKNKFIKTTDKDTADILREAGFIEVGKEGNKWVFINNDKIQFSMDEMKDVHITDILHF